MHLHFALHKEVDPKTKVPAAPSYLRGRAEEVTQPMQSKYFRDPTDESVRHIFEDYSKFHERLVLLFGPHKERMVLHEFRRLGK